MVTNLAVILFYKRLFPHGLHKSAFFFFFFQQFGLQAPAAGQTLRLYYKQRFVPAPFDRGDRDEVQIWKKNGKKVGVVGGEVGSERQTNRHQTQIICKM